MAVTRYSSFDVTVNTIADRNALIRKVNHMTVLVKDAIADPSAGQGKATYRWDASDNTWVMVSKSTFDTISFITEELTIANNEVQLSNYPSDNQVWGGVILNGTLIVADLDMSAVTVANGKITGLNNDVNGLILRITYAYGTVAAQIGSAINDGITTSIASLLTQGGLAAASDLTTHVNDSSIHYTMGDISITKSQISDLSLDFASITSKPTTISGYGITDAYTKSEVETKIVQLAPATDISGKADITYVDSQIATLTNLAPTTLNTFKEIADQLVTDEGAVSALTTVVAGKVDKVSGKGLSTEDYTTAEKTKLAGIASGAEVNVNADWNSTSGDSQILNKPTTINGFSITDAYTKTEVDNSLSNKVDKVSGKGLSTEDYTTVEKTKLAGIAANANNYSLPIASSTVLGGVKAGTNISIDADGVISANDTSIDWSEITSKPTTLSGYGITDSIQSTLVSGTNIKTINGTSVLGSGDITISGGATLSDDTSTNSTYYPTFAIATSGNMSTAKVSSTKLTFNPSTGTLAATELNSLSDVNKKENIVSITNGLEIINKLNGVEFDWKENGNHSSGVIAQELEKVLPFLVTEIEGTKTVNYLGIIGYLINAVQELSKK